MFVRNLLRTLGNYDSNQDFYIGLYWTPRVDMEWREVKLAYASGGAGYAISRHLLKRLAPRMRRCHGNYTRWAGDVRVGKCILDLGVRITAGVGFHHESHDKYEWDNSGGGFPYGHLSKRASATVSAPVTFHHLHVDQLALYDRMQFVEERGANGELYRFDFAGLLFKQFRAVDAHLKRHFRVLFGISVDVANPHSRSDNFVKEYSDPLYIRRVRNPDGEANRFEVVIAKQPQVFDGDGCHARITDPFRLPLRRAAVIDLICVPCRASGASANEPPGLNQICKVWYQDDCTLKIQLSVPCPPRQLVYAPTLELGTVLGRADLISQGMPAKCLSNVEGPNGALSENSTLWGFLTHGELVIEAPTVSSQTPGCHVQVVRRGAEDTMATGGVLRSSLGVQPLSTRCLCEGSASLANISLTIHVLEYTSPVVSFVQHCSHSSDQVGT